MELTLQQLRMLRAVAQRGTIAAAASAMGYTPSAVSQQLSGLERATGVAVLERVGRLVRLTDPGRELVRHAEGVLAKVEEAEAALQRVNGEVRGTVEVSVFESVMNTLLPPLLRRLATDYPALDVHTRQMDPDLALRAVASGQLDLAFVLDYPHAPGAPVPGVDRAPVCRDWWRMVLPDDDPLTGQRIALEKLRDRDFICSPPELGCGRSVVMACRDAGFEPRIRHQLDDYPAALRLVAAGAGVALVPDLGLVHLPPGVRIVDLEVPVSRTLELAYRGTSADRPALRAVCDSVTVLAQDLGLDLVTDGRQRPSRTR